MADELEQAAGLPETEQLKQIDTLLDVPTTLSLTNLDGVTTTHPLATFNVYKTSQVLKMLAAIREKVDMVELIGEIVTLAQSTQTDAQRIQTAFSALPKLMEFAPDLLVDFAALAIIPNKELAAAYDTGTIDDLRAANRKKLAFEFDPSAPIKVLAAYLPHIGINFILAELGKLDTSVVTSFAANKKA